MTKEPPPVLFSMDEAFDFVVEHLPDIVAATLTPDDVRRILGVPVRSSSARRACPPTGRGSIRPRRDVHAAVIGGDEDDRLHPRPRRRDRRGVPPGAGLCRWSRPSSSTCGPSARSSTPADDAADPDPDRRGETPDPSATKGVRGIRVDTSGARATKCGTRERRWSTQCMINVGLWRCAAVRPSELSAGPPGGIPTAAPAPDLRDLVPPGRAGSVHLPASVQIRRALRRPAPAVGVSRRGPRA